MSADEALTRGYPSPPTTISGPAQEALREPRQARVPEPDETADRAAWAAYVDEMNASVAPAVDALLGQLPLPVSTIDIDGVATVVAEPAGATDTTPVYLYIHGGGWMLGGGRGLGLVAAFGAAHRDMITWAIDYRMAPHWPFPAGLDDCLTVYRAALRQRAASDVFVGGVSAGANLAAATVARAKDHGLDMPAGLVLLTPATDLTLSGDTITTNADLDSVLGPHHGPVSVYAAGHDLTDPYLSPLFADLSGFPPTMLQSGTRDLLLSDTVRMHRALLAAGVRAELHVWEAMPHGGFGGTTPEDLELADTIRAFVDRHRRDR